MVESQPIAQAVFNRYGFTHTATADDLRKNIIRVTILRYLCVLRVEVFSVLADDRSLLCCSGDERKQLVC